MAARSRTSSGLTRRSFVGAGGTALVGAAAGGARWWELADAAEALAARSAARRNIVLIVIDSLRADALGCYGNRVVRTPNIDALARESVRFTRVFPEAMPTVPARRSILTGRHAFPFRGWRPWVGMPGRPGWAPIMPGSETLATMLGRRGYWTGYVTDNQFLGYGSVFEPFRRTFHHYSSVPGQRTARRPYTSVSRAEALHRLPRPLRTDFRIREIRQYLADNGGAENDAEQACARVFRGAADLLSAAARHRPFFLGIDSFDPHEPWTPPRKYLDLYGDPDYRGQEIADVIYGKSDYLTGALPERLLATYAACVTMVDHWVGHFLDVLDRMRLSEETVIALVSDHGIYLGERGRTGKGDSPLHPELIHVPLLIRAAGGRGGRRKSDYFATTVDISPTLMSLAGIRPPRPLDGIDLSRIFRGRAPREKRPIAYGGYANFSFVRDERWKVIARNDYTGVRLYDLAADPGERRNVFGQHPDVARELWRRMGRDVGGSPPRHPQERFDAEPRSLGG